MCQLGSLHYDFEHHKVVLWKCGKCPECLREKRNDYVQRSYLESLRWQKVCKPIFLTLTYREIDYVELKKNKAFRSDFQCFLKRLRKNLGIKNLRYIAVYEFGEMHNRLHWHVIFFNVPYIDCSYIEKLWSHGFVKLKSCSTFGSILYVTKYIVKALPTGFLDEFGLHRRFCSSQYLGCFPPLSVIDYARKNFKIPIGGCLYNISKYLRSKLFDNETNNQYSRSVNDYQYDKQKSFRSLFWQVHKSSDFNSQDEVDFAFACFVRRHLIPVDILRLINLNLVNSGICLVHTKLNKYEYIQINPHSST